MGTPCRRDLDDVLERAANSGGSVGYEVESAQLLIQLSCWTDAHSRPRQKQQQRQREPMLMAANESVTKSSLASFTPQANPQSGKLGGHLLDTGASWRG